MTEGGDIAYRVYHKTAQNEIVELVPHSRVDSNLFNEEGELECENAGKCKDAKFLFRFIRN